MTLVIPCAGNGSRFKQAGYAFPKPLIEVENNMTMIEMVVKNLDYDGQHIFIVQQAHIDEFHIDKTLKLIEPTCIIIPVDKTTEGAACTVLLAKEYIDNSEELIVANSDQFVPDFDIKKFLNFGMQPYSNPDGVIVVFNATHPKWSFVKLKEISDIEGFPYNVISEVAEKNPISNIATVGIYGWNHGKDFVWAAEEMIRKNIRTNNEFYLAPTYNELIAIGKKIAPYYVKTIYGTGTPEDLEIFLQRKQ